MTPTLDELNKFKFVVLGDFIVDRYRVLQSERISPEADVIIYHQISEDYRAGGAGNVANNLATMGARVHLYSVGGDDISLDMIFPNTILADPTRKTTIKERLVTKRQQIARIDDQTREPISGEMTEQLISHLDIGLVGASALVLSDYNHGVMTKRLVAAAIHAAKDLNIPIIVDSKAPDTMLKYKGTTIVMPNHQEAISITGMAEFDDDQVAEYLLKKMNLKSVAITLGANGILLCTPEGCQRFPPLELNTREEVKDVTGAGDTVTAATAVGLALGLSLPQVMRLANVAAGVVVKKMGVATATVEELRQAIHSSGVEGLQEL